MSEHTSKIAAAAAVIIMWGGLAVWAAAPAGAAAQGSPGCSVSHGWNVSTSPPPTIFAHYSVTCEERTAPGEIVMTQTVDGRLVTVASGWGAVYYNCNGLPTDVDFVDIGTVTVTSCH